MARRKVTATKNEGTEVKKASAFNLGMTYGIDYKTGDVGITNISTAKTFEKDKVEAVDELTEELKDLWEHLKEKGEILLVKGVDDDVDDEDEDDEEDETNDDEEDETNDDEEDETNDDEEDEDDEDEDDEDEDDDDEDDEDDEDEDEDDDDEDEDDDDEDEDDDDEDEDDDDEEEKDYYDMTEKELREVCKERKIKKTIKGTPISKAKKGALAVTLEEWDENN